MGQQLNIHVDFLLPSRFFFALLFGLFVFWVFWGHSHLHGPSIGLLLHQSDFKPELEVPNLILVRLSSKQTIPDLRIGL